VALGQVFSENFGFPCQSIFHLLSTIIFTITRGWHNRPGSGRSANSLTNKKKKKPPELWRGRENYRLTISVYSYPCKLNSFTQNILNIKSENWLLFTKETQVVYLLTQAFIFLCFSYTFHDKLKNYSAVE
jgi:hypothetical protein